jgi:hypothetical protein
MKLYCRGRYHNQPAGLFFDGPGVIEIDDPKALFLLKDAPENFSTEIPAPPQAAALDEPAADKMVKSPARKKTA